IRDAAQAECRLVIVLKRRGIVGIASHQESSHRRSLVAAFRKRDLTLDDSGAQPGRNGESMAVSTDVQQSRAALYVLKSRIDIALMHNEVLDRIEKRIPIEPVPSAFLSFFHHRPTALKSFPQPR